MCVTSPSAMNYEEQDLLVLLNRCWWERNGKGKGRKGRKGTLLHSAI